MTYQPDQSIYDDFPWIIASAEKGCRWVPLRMACAEFDAMRADTIIMHETGLLVRTKPLYVWYAWPAELLTQRRRAGAYGQVLMKSLKADILEGTCIYLQRPWR